MKHLKAMLVLLGALVVVFPAMAQNKTADPPKPAVTATAPAVDKDIVIQIQALEIQRANLIIQYNQLQSQFEQSPQVQQLQTQSQSIAQQINALKAKSDAEQKGKYELDLNTLTNKAVKTAPPAAKEKK